MTEGGTKETLWKNHSRNAVRQFAISILPMRIRNRCRLIESSFPTSNEVQKEMATEGVRTKVGEMLKSSLMIL